MRFTNLLVPSLLWAVACAELPSDDCPNLRTAKSLTIVYSVGVGHSGSPNRRLVVSKPAKLLSLLHVKSTLKGASVGLAPCGLLEFDLPDAGHCHCVMVEPDQLGLRWGTLFLKTRRFYDEVNVLLSAHEGRPIDVLKDN